MNEGTAASDPVAAHRTPAELVLAAVAAWDRGDKEALLACFDPGFTFILSGQILDQPLEIHGTDEYGRFFDQWLESWETFSFGADNPEELGAGRVLVRTRQHGVSREGIGVERVVWFVADTGSGLITRYRAFTEEAEARAAADVDSLP